MSSSFPPEAAEADEAELRKWLSQRFKCTGLDFCQANELAQQWHGNSYALFHCSSEEIKGFFPGCPGVALAGDVEKARNFRIPPVVRTHFHSSQSAIVDLLLT